MTSASEVKKEERKPPPKNPARKMKIPRMHPEIMAVKNPFQARSLFSGADVLRNEGGQTLHDGRRDQHDEGYDFLSDAVSGGGMRPMLLTMELMTRKEICTMVS